MESNNFCLVIVATFLIFAGKSPIAAGERSFVTLHKPFFSSNLKESKDVLKNKSVLGLQSKEPTKKDDETRTLKVETTLSFTEKDTTVSATTSQVEATSVSSTENTQSKAPTTKINKMSTPLGDTTTASSTQKDTTVSTTTSQVQTTATTSTQVDTTVATTSSAKTCTHNWPSPETTSGHYCSCWKKVGNTEYMISEKIMNFNDSRQFCQAYGGDIAVLNTTDVQGAVRNIMNDLGDGVNNEGDLWIGIIRVQPERKFFEWLDCRNFSVIDDAWVVGQPNDSPGPQDCVASIRRDEWKLQDKKCMEQYFALCQREKLDLPDCDGLKDWKFWNNSWYHFISTEMTWDCATSTCDSQCKTSHLVFIESREANDFITKELVTDWSDEVWIGLRKEEDVWMWYNTTKNVPKELKGDDKHDCVVIKKDGNHDWERHDCTHTHHLVCEAEKKV